MSGPLPLSFTGYRNVYRIKRRFLQELKRSIICARPLVPIYRRLTSILLGGITVIDPPVIDPSVTRIWLGRVTQGGGGFGRGEGGCAGASVLLLL